MFWNEIRDHIRERLPAIVDFILFAAAMTIIAAVLLGLVAVYVEYGMAVFGIAVALFCLVGFWSERRSPAYFDNSGNPPPSLPPLGTQAPPPAAPQIGRSRRPALPGPKK